LETKKLKSASGENNFAVKELFGFAKDSKAEKRDKETDKKGQRGRVIFSDLFLSKGTQKVLNHVAIDRFTGGAMDGALFAEKVCTRRGVIVQLALLVERDAFAAPLVQEAFEAALKDMATGMLPLGGGVMRGHGCFQGSITRNGEKLV
jgi:hypothetical protein